MKMDVLEEISIDNAALRCEMGILEGELRTSRAECCRFKRSERAAVAQVRNETKQGDPKRWACHAPLAFHFHFSWRATPHCHPTHTLCRQGCQPHQHMKATVSWSSFLRLTTTLLHRVVQASKLDRRVAELESELSRLRAQPSEPPPPQQPPHVPAVAEAPAAGDSGDWWRRLSQLSALEKQRALQIICAELEREQVPGTGQLLSCSSFSSLS